MAGLIFFSYYPKLDSYFGPKKSQIWNSLNRILIFNPLERQKLYYYQVCDSIFTTSSNKHLHPYIFVEKAYIVTEVSVQGGTEIQVYPTDLCIFQQYLLSTLYLCLGCWFLANTPCILFIFLCLVV